MSEWCGVEAGRKPTQKLLMPESLKPQWMMKASQRPLHVQINDNPADSAGSHLWILAHI